MSLKLLFDIFISFLKIGPVTFGGGYAIIPMIEREVVTRKKWVAEEEIADVMALAQTVPGAVGVNSATFIGYRLAGIPGALAALTGIMLPTFLIIVLLCTFFFQFRHHPMIEAAFVSIRITILAMITYAAIRIGKTALVDKTSIVLVILTVMLMLFLNIHPFGMIVGGGLVGIGAALIRKRFGRKKHENAEHEQQAEVHYKSNDYFIGDGI